MAVVRIAEAAGINTAPLLRANGIKLDIGFDTDMSLTVDSIRNFYKDIARNAGDDWFFWKHVPRSQPENFGYYSHLAVTAPTLGDAFESLARNINTLVSQSVIEINDSGPAVTLSYTIRDDGTAPCRELSEAVVGFGILIARTALGPDWSPDTVYFEHDRPDTIVPYRASCPAKYVFNAPAAGMSFDKTCLAAPMPGANIYLQKAVENYIANVIGKHTGFSRIALEVRTEIAAHIRDGVPALEEIAGHLKMSPRTLQRRLREAETSYSDVLEELRHDLADKMLANRDIPVSEISYLLGYADPSSFDRAYRGWTGKTPVSARRTP